MVFAVQVSPDGDKSFKTNDKRNLKKRATDLPMIVTIEKEGA